MKIILAATFALLIIGSSETRSSAWASADQPRTADAERLKKVHGRLLVEYPVERRKNLNTPTTLARFYLRLTAALEDAGVKELLDDKNAGFAAPATRIAILNDYGFWLSKTSDPRSAIPVLQKVTELAPARAVAQLNLGDTARSALTVAETWDQKNNLATIALQAYSAYQKLASKDAPAAKEFQALHAIGAVGPNVCSYVAAFYNHGRQEEMWGYPDPVDIAGDGKLRHVYIFEQGTAHLPVIFASTNAIPEENKLNEALAGDEVDFERTVDPSSAEDYGSRPELHVLPFGDGYYLVHQEDGGPVAVVKPNAGTVCRFKRSFTPVLVEDHAPAICKEAATGKAFRKIPDQTLSNKETPTIEALDRLHLPGTGSPDFQRYSDVKLDPMGAPGRIGYYEYNSDSGPGCDSNGVAFLNGQAFEKSARAKALIEAQVQTMDCRGSTAFLVHANGENLVELDGGRVLQRTTPPRTLLRLRGDRFETVCRVEQRATYIPEQIGKAH
jgi:hypothetical protein